MIDGAVHISGVTAPKGVEDLPEEYGWCCAGSACQSVHHCTCWEPIYDLEQAPLDLSTEPVQRTKCCGDCAYRNDSPERQDAGDQERDVLALAYAEGNEFWCHQGSRRVVVFRHPLGAVLPAGEGDYRAPVGPNAAGVECVWRADGTAGERCAGWAAHRRGLEPKAEASKQEPGS